MGNSEKWTVDTWHFAPSLVFTIDKQYIRCFREHTPPGPCDLDGAYVPLTSQLVCLLFLRAAICLGIRPVIQTNRKGLNPGTSAEAPPAGLQSWKK